MATTAPAVPVGRAGRHPWLSVLWTAARTPRGTAGLAMAALVVLVALVGGRRLPWGIPAALAAVLAGTAIFWARWALTGAGGGEAGPVPTALVAVTVKV